jgi:hypothetical protein
MSFEKLSKKDLVAVAEEFGVTSTGTKEAIINELEAEGVTFELYQSLKDNGDPDAADASAEGESEVVEAAPTDGVYGPVEGPEVILAYRSGVGSYGNVYGNWSVKAPFSVVAKSVADGMIAEMPGLFEVASEAEVDAFYN